MSDPLNIHNDAAGFAIFNVLFERGEQGIGFNELGREAGEINAKSLNTRLKRYIAKRYVEKSGGGYRSGRRSTYKITAEGRKFVSKRFPKARAYAWARRMFQSLEKLLLAEPSDITHAIIALAPLPSGETKLFIIYEPDRVLNKKAVDLLRLPKTTFQLLHTSHARARTLETPVEKTPFLKNLDKALNLVLKGFVESGGSTEFVNKLHRLYER